MEHLLATGQMDLFWCLCGFLGFLLVFFKHIWQVFVPLITTDSCLCWLVADDTKQVACCEQHLALLSLWARRVAAGGEAWLLWVISGFTDDISPSAPWLEIPALKPQQGV